MSLTSDRYHMAMAVGQGGQSHHQPLVNTVPRDTSSPPLPPVSVTSVPKFVDLGGRRHPLVNNFPLSHVIFKVNCPLSNDHLAVVSAKQQQQRQNTGLSLKSTRLSSFIEFISHILLSFHSSWLFNAQIFHSRHPSQIIILGHCW